MSSSHTASSSEPHSNDVPRDVTFRNYALKAAQDYAKLRGAYPAQLIELILAKHTSTGGKLHTLLDVGCGPGTATRQLALHFQHALGIDPGESMISTARATEPAIVNANGTPVEFAVCSAESLATIVPRASVDLLTAATALHWFELPQFYAAAGYALKPGGTLAAWVASDIIVDPDTTANAVAVQREFDAIFQLLAPFETLGNRASRELYVNLPTPWSVDVSALDESSRAEVMCFDQTLSERIEFNVHGRREPALITEDNSKGYLRAFRAPLELLRQSIGTASQVTRWRAAHKEALGKGEVEDVADVIIKKVRAAMMKGADGRDRDWIDIVTPMVLLVYKKSAQSTLFERG